MGWLTDITLEHDTVKLVPMTHQHTEGLVNAAKDGELWELWFTGVPNADSIDDYVSRALIDKSEGTALPFVVIDKSTGDVIGATRFCNAVNKYRRVEIGFTWYAKRFQKTSVNTECKLLLLAYAFEHKDAIAVEFRTHWHNKNSQAAITKLGAKQDGILRNHTVEPDGTLRDTVVYSIINTEWPAVRKSLNFRLKRYKS